MKRCKNAFMALAALLLLAASMPMSCKAQEERVERTLEEVLQDETCIFEDAVGKLYAESEPVTALRNVEREVKDAFYGRLTAAEKYKFGLLYKYALLSGTTNAKEQRVTQEQLDEDLTYYQALVQMQKEEASEDGQLKKQFQIWEEEAFQLVKDNIESLIYDLDEEEKHMTGFLTYEEYLQSAADFSISELSDALGEIEKTAIGSDSDTALENVKMCFYKIYGFTIETETQAEIEKDMEEETEIGAEAVEEVKIPEPMERQKQALQVNAVARIGDTYYRTFDEAFSALPPGGTMYVLQDCIAGHNVTTKSFTICPEGKNVTVTASSSLGPDPAGIIAVPTGTDPDIAGIWTLAGNEGYTLTIDGNRKCSSGLLSSLCKITINLRSGVRLKNGAANGVWNSRGTTNVYKDVFIYNNLHAGVASQGTINMYGGEIYGNGNNGLRAKSVSVAGGQVHHNGSAGVQTQAVDSNTTISVTEGNIYGNASDGVAAYAANGVCTVGISGGNIYSNNAAGVRASLPAGTVKISGSSNIYQNATGIITSSAAVMSGGAVYENYNGGIYTSNSFTMTGGSVCANVAEKNGGGIYNSGTLLLSGGEISSNSGVFGGGIYNVGTLNLTDTAIINNSARAGGAVYQNGSMNMSGAAWIEEKNDVYLPETGNVVTVTGFLTAPKTVARITPSAYTLGRTCIRVSYNKEKGSSVYQKFSLTPKSFYVLRPGDYQSGGANTAETDIVVSRAYTIHYEGNYNDTGIRVPKDEKKYWNEAAKISPELPYFGSVRFKGWGRNADGQDAAYQPGDTISAPYNEDLTFFALWETKIKIIYMNSADAEPAKSEYVTLRECRENNGYEVRKNADYTHFIQEGYSFTGWADDKRNAAAGVIKFPESRKNIVTFEKLCQISNEQHNDAASMPVMPEVRLYSVWDKVPEIISNGTQEFYEGTEVTKEMLLSGVKAFDKEDGDITENVRIVSIKYADRKHPDKTKWEGETVIWKKDMPVAEKLDTWFLQMEKEDSPAVHLITYAVTDSMGAETVLECAVKVRYNEFPAIEAADRYFTLEEAQEGNITEAELVKYGLKSGRIKVSDPEDDVLHPGSLSKKIKLVDFKPEEFLEFNRPGYIVLTCSVQDSMGPGGAGKETLFQFTVFILKDGEIIRPDGPKYVRFIDQGNYEKNAYRKIENLSREEKETLNQNGGLHLDSRWYQNPEYKELLLGLWGKEQTADKVWNFSQEDVRKVKEYINIHGIGNSREKNALCNFLKQFYPVNR